MGLFTQNFITQRYALGRIDGVTNIQLIGRNTDLDATEESFIGVGGTYAQLTAAVAFEAVSSDANDTSAGTGARTITTKMVDGNYVETEVSITMNGATPVAITGTFLACNGGRVATAGSTGTNAGNIDIRVVAGSVVKRRIPFGTLGAGRDQDFIYTIPAGRIGYLPYVRYQTSGGAGGFSVWLNTATSAGVIVAEGADQAGFSTITDCEGVVDFGYGLKIPEKTLIDLRIIAASGSNLVASAMANLLVFETSKLS